MRVFHSTFLRECEHFTLFWRLAYMKNKRKSNDEKLQLIMECRNSGLSDYQWCKCHDINPSTFYNWITRLHKQGTVIQEALTDDKKPPLKQEVVKLELVPQDTTLSVKTKEDLRSLKVPTSTENPAVEFVFENATVRFFHGIDQQLAETMLKCLGGAIHVR